MADVLTSLLIPALTVILIFTPTITGQTQCTDALLTANEIVMNITSPNYPNNYSNNMDCKWLITSTLSSHVIVLKLLDFHLEDQLACTYDYVAVYDGNTTASPRIRKFCGRFPLTTFTSSGNFMTIEFHSDSNKNYKGFKFEYSTQEKTAQCPNAFLVANETATNITSPGYPYNYPSEVNCTWHITTYLTSNVIVFGLLDFYLENSPSCRYDYVAIYDGNTTVSPRIQKMCGQFQNASFISTGNSMTVVFYSDYSDNYKGFKFQFTSQKSTVKCRDVTLTASTSTQYFSSPNYPNNYPSNLDCLWYITTYLTSNVVVLNLLDFYTEGTLPSCSDDYVTFYDGSSRSSPKIKSLCGQISNTTIISSGNSMTVLFHSDSLINYKGFKFLYSSQDTSVVCEENNLIADDTTKYITTPGYPNSYQRYGQHIITFTVFNSENDKLQLLGNLNCRWKITASLTSKVVLLKVWDFNIEGVLQSCSYDYVNIYDGNGTYSSMIASLCGELSYTQYTSSGRYMTVVFHSDSSISNRGFKLEYKNVETSDSCTDVTLLAEEDVKFFTSPNYPYPYPSNTDCQWHISSGFAFRVISVRFSQFILQGYEPSCNNDYVKIYDGASIAYPEIELMCGQPIDRDIESTSTDMTIVFHSDASKNYEGFSFSYYSKMKINSNEDMITDSSPGLNVGVIVAITIGAVALLCFFVAFVICIKRTSIKQPRTTQNIAADPNYGRDVGVRQNTMYIVSQPNMNPSTPIAPYVGMVNSQNTLDPPSHSNLSTSVNAATPFYGYNGPINNVNILPPPYSSVLPGWTAHQEEKSGAHLNKGFNVTNNDEVVRDHTTSQDVSANVNPSSDNSISTSAISSFPQPYSDENPSISDNNLPSSTTPASN